MFTKATLTTAILLPLALAAPTRRADTMTCTQYKQGQFGVDADYGGYLDLWSNVTSTTNDDFVTYRVGLIHGKVGVSDATFEPCFECSSPELFGFEICQGNDNFPNTPELSYGHITYQNRFATNHTQCVAAETQHLGGLSLVMRDCEYDSSSAGTTGQFWAVKNPASTNPQATLINFGDDVNYGPANEMGPLVLGNAKANDKSAYLGFKPHSVDVAQSPSA